ncbi:MAG: PH domain-containing protein [Solirubrobacteraceae bacterium]
MAAIFDKQDQLDRIQAGLLQGETVLAVYDGKGAGTGFIGLTDRRVVLQDNSFVGKRMALTSIPYSRVNAVSFVSDKSMLGKFASSSSVALEVGGKTYEVEFRGEEKAKHAHDTILRLMI